MSVPSAKRQRSNTNGDSSATAAAVPSTSKSSREEIEKLVEIFDGKTIRELLISAALEVPAIQTKLQLRCTDIILMQNAKVINFDHYNQEVLDELASGAGLKGSKQYELSGKVYRAIADIIATIRNQCPSHSSFETKKSALETLRTIGENICYENDDTLGSEVIKSFQYDSCLDDAMLEIVSGMTEHEKERMRTSSESFVVKMRDLIKESRIYCVFDKSNVVLKVLQGKDATDHHGDDDDDPESGEGEEQEDSESEEEMDEETRDRMVQGNRPARRNMCRGCGCGQSLCSSCWGDWGDEM